MNLFKYLLTREFVLFFFRRVFDIVDRDKSGSLSKREAKRACNLIAEKFGIKEVSL